MSTMLYLENLATVCCIMRDAWLFPLLAYIGKQPGTGWQLTDILLVGSLGNHSVVKIPALQIRSREIEFCCYFFFAHPWQFSCYDSWNHNKSVSSLTHSSQIYSGTAAKLCNPWKIAHSSVSNVVGNVTLSEHVIVTATKYMWLLENTLT